MSWAMRSPSCSQQDEVAREVGALGVVDEQVAQQQGGALDVAPALLEEREDLEVRAGAVQQSHHETLARLPSPDASRLHRSFTADLQPGNERRRPRRDAQDTMEAAERPLDDVLYVGALEIRPDRRPGARGRPGR